MIRLELDPAAGALYQQIVDQVKGARARGELLAGERLPTVRALAKELGVNPNTVSHAYRLLQQDGVIAGQPGRGTEVTAVATTTALALQRLRTQIEPVARDALSDGLSPLLITTVMSDIVEHIQPHEQGEQSYQPSEIVVRYFGSHDFCLDVLARRLRAHHPKLQFSWTPVGSTTGLLAVGHGEADLTGVHLLDRATGEYNRPAADRLLPGVAIRFVTLAHREQGLFVRRGNPLGLRTIEDLVHPGVRFASRQPGSGTSALLDYLLGLRGLAIAQLNVTRELTTHLEVASAVAGGTADAGLGVRSAARALDLDFVPMWRERFDLAYRRSDEDAPWLAPMLEVLTSPAFRADIEALEGYDGSRTGWFS